MNELDPDLYREKLSRVSRRYDTFSAWLALAVAAFIFVAYAFMSDSNESVACAPRLQDPARHAPNSHASSTRGDWSQRADRQDLDGYVTEIDEQAAAAPMLTLCR